MRLLAVVTLLIVPLGILVYLGVRISSELAALRAAPTDNVQWSLAQLRVEALILDQVVDDLGQGTAKLQDVRQRFDILYSRIDTLQHGRVFRSLASDPAVHDDLSALRLAVDELVPLIDGSDEELQANLERLARDVAALLPLARDLSLDGVRHFAERSDLQRDAFSELLLQTAMAALILIVLLAVVVGGLVLQSRVAQRRAHEIARTNRLHASIMTVSLDAIVVIDENGKIIDFNPAAEALFGYSRNRALGSTMGDMIVPPEAREAHRAGLQRYLKTGEARIVGKGRIEVEAMRAGGETFPVEVSIGSALGANGVIFIAYIRDISKRKQTERDLVTARDEALAAARAKSQFLAVMSHEMRTPLNGVMGVLDLLADTDLDSRQRRYLQTATLSGEILQHHIDDVLDITRLEAGALSLEPERFDLPALMREVAHVNEPAAEARGNRIEVDADPTVEFIFEDKDRLRQVLLNIVSNAVKFTENGSIRIIAEQSRTSTMESWLEISVRDTGIGIPREHRERIFEDFYMLDPSYRRRSQGSGLGLAISRRIIDAMGGEIGVESKPGVGSRFWFRLPARDTDSDTQESVEIDPPIEPTVATAGVPEPTISLSVLLVEDNEVNRFVAREIVTKAGCDVTEAHDGIQGVEAAASRHFDLILMDISMPRLDGLEATHQIRSGDGPSRDTLIYGLTAHAMPEEQGKIRDVGMQGCLIKPLRIETFRRLLTEITAAEEHDSEGDEDPNPAKDVLDPEVIAELREVLPEDVFKMRLEAFLQELDEAAAYFARVNNESNTEVVRKTAHRYAGSAAVFGAKAFRDTITRVEEACASDDREAAGTLTDDVLQAVKSTQVAIREFTA